jgi:hypothetical protein
MAIGTKALLYTSAFLTTVDNKMLIIGGMPLKIYFTAILTGSTSL